MKQPIDSGNVDIYKSPVAYRPDIDGLRALAVLAVIAFHTNARLVPGGFAGVDIFFVISGFLISGLIYKELDRGSFRFITFYTRRIKRILPVLAVVCAVTSIATLYLLSPNDLVYYTTSLVACWGFASNVFFSLLSGGYFDTRFSTFPLLHTWSLGVEEQFYFVFPVLFALALRFQRAQLQAISVILAIAFVLLSQAHSSDPRAYYLLHFRAHELLIGLIALLAIRDFPIRSQATANIVCCAGLALTLSSLYLLNARSAFPGFNSLYPCIGSALIIYSGPEAAFFRPLLTNRPIVFVGLMSYSLYLWHWPILSLLRYRGIALSMPVAVGAVACTFALSYLSWRLVERPIRANAALSFKAAAAWFYLLPAAVFFGFGVLSFGSAGIPNRFAPELRELMASYSTDPDLSRSCATRPLDDQSVSLGRLVEKCSFADTTQAKASILLFGDSHANHIVPFVGVLAHDAHLRGVYHVMGACPPTARQPQMDARADGNNQVACAHNNATMLGIAHDFSFVVLGGNWAAIKSGFEEDLTIAVDTVIRAGAIPVVIRDTPASADDPALCVLRQARGWLPTSTDCNVPYAAVSQAQAGSDLAIDHVKAKHPTMIVIDPKSVMCNATECSSRIANLAVYRDSNHINEKAATAIAHQYLVSYGNPFLTNR